METTVARWQVWTREFLYGEYHTIPFQAWTDVAVKRQDVAVLKGTLGVWPFKGVPSI